MTVPTAPFGSTAASGIYVSSFHDLRHSFRTRGLRSRNVLPYHSAKMVGVVSPVPGHCLCFHEHDTPSRDDFDRRFRMPSRR
jgi:hypothetical protein